EISNAINNLQYRKIALEGLSWACAGQGRFKEAYNYYVQFKNVNDSIYNIEKNKQITLAEAQYQNEKKQLLIKNQESELAMQSEKMKKQKILIYSFIVGILVILIFSILLYRQFRQKKMANIMLERKNHMIQLQNKEISAQKDEIQSQRDLVTQQKNQIEIIHKELTDSIHYACRIQQAVLPEDVLLQEILASHFILFKPRDVVSGDFYWCTILKNYLIFAVADCTGHGVPGAFMSMIGVTFLNEIVSKIDIPDPAFILNALRQNIIRALHQQGTVGEQKDGMDIALVILDLVPEPIWIENGECKEIFHVKFAGANNPLVIVKKATLPVSQETNPAIAGENNPCQMIEIAANSMPIGIYDKMDEFVNREIQINKGDMLYVFSDGFSDQFGGPKGKKFMSKKLKGLLVSIAPKPVDEQKEILDKTIEEWKAHINSYTHEPFEQTDDITVMGVRL
ncbi:MAG: SpoIIE family protein phosphatase, partial [Bacteroidia bacterium]|nr:SpoIIE family protein phosphatase [Bacteroidia bacterium]